MLKTTRSKMKYYSQYRNHDLFDLQELLSRFCKSNRWVKLGDNLPWDNIVREYNKRLQYRHAGADNKTASYSLAMGYDNMHRITSKKQHLSQTGVQFDGTLNAGYELVYTYGSAEGKKFQLDNVRDINYRTEETPTDSTNINNGHKYTYDANGNLVYINTSRVKRDGKEDEKASEQKFRWDEENRLLAADENGFVSNYWYDADGERTVKSSGENEAIYVNYRASRVQCQVCLSIAEAQPIITESNSEFSGGNTGTARFSLYVSPYLVAGQGGKYTKHIYIGSQRIVSKLGDLASYGADPRRIPYAGKEADGLTIDYKDKYNQQLQSIKDNYKAFDQPYNGKDNDDYVNGQGFCCNDGTPEAAQARVMARTRAANGNFKPNDDYEKMQFYYHPDHLGSSSYITNLDGEVSQHIEYVPFGEVFIEERNNTWNTPYLFNAKEFDEETGMYYYGARYYEPRLSLWISTDPMQDRYPSISTYCHTLNNPLNISDPNGTDIVYVNLGGVEVYRIKNDNVYKTYIQTSKSYYDPAKTNRGWKEVPMPKIIQTRPSTHENVSDNKYQENDYLIAARTGYFNQAKKYGVLDLYAEGGKEIPTEAIKQIPDLDPTLVKAICIQESHAGLKSQDIMTSNNPGDWEDGKLKEAYGMKKTDNLDVSNSLYYGIRILATKGFKGGITYNKNTGKLSYEFRGWGSATNNFNGGGVKNYQKDVETMVKEAKPRN